MDLLNPALPQNDLYKPYQGRTVREVIPSSSCLMLALWTLLLSCGCSKPHVMARAADGKTSLMISRVPHGPDVSAEITLLRGNSAKVVYEETEDRYIGPVEVSWSSDGKTAAVLICSTIAPSFQLRIDVPTGSATRIQSDTSLNATILRRYGKVTDVSKVVPEKAPEWLCGGLGYAYFSDVTRESGGVHQLDPVN